MSRFIVLEGIDGCGSTTQAKLLVTRIERQGAPAQLTCEPSPGPLGKQLREILAGRALRENGDSVSADWATLALLFAADRLDHLASVVNPALERGTVVVSDRYDLSSIVYQSVTASDAERAAPWIRSLNVHARRPDLTVVIDASPSTAGQRRRQRGGPAELFEEDELQIRLARASARAEALVPGDRVVHVNGDGSVEDVAEAVWRVVEPLVRRH